MRIIHPLRSVSEGENMCVTSSLGEKTMKVQASRKALQQLAANMPPTQNNFEALMKVDQPSCLDSFWESTRRYFDVLYAEVWSTNSN